jgi:murein endopeptidase
MIGMLEWLGREVSREYQDSDRAGTRLFVGDISAPRGGCLAGRGGRRGHASHTNGQDVDLGFLVPNAHFVNSARFETRFDAKANGWLLKKVFENPFACVRVIFLDRKLIRKLDQQWSRESWWQSNRRYLRHMPGHKNHFHIRIGDLAGPPGCGPGADPELEAEEDLMDLESLESPEASDSSNTPTGAVSDRPSVESEGGAKRNPASEKFEWESDEDSDSDTESGEARLKKFLEESLKLDGSKSASRPARKSIKN